MANYNISSWADLNDVRNDLTGDYTLTTNLDSGSSGYTGIGDSWNSIGTFTGTFDGNGHVISNIRSGGALFSDIDGGTVSNLQLNDYVRSVGSNTTSIFATVIKGSTISKCSVINSTASASGWDAALLIGATTASPCTIEDCYVLNSSITGTVWSSGSLVSLVNTATTIRSCYSSATLNGSDYIGGLVGVVNGGSTLIMSNCFFIGTISITGTYSGGIVGSNLGGYTLSNNFWWASQANGIGGVGTNEVAGQYEKADSADDFNYQGSGTGGAVYNSYWDFPTTWKYTSTLPVLYYIKVYATLTYSLDTPNVGEATITGRSSSGNEDVVIPATIGGQNVVAIVDNSFYNQSDLTSLDLSGATNLLTIGTSAFYACSGFTGTLTIGNSVTSIGITAFGMCTGFAGSLVIPNSVTSIGPGAFYGCSGFTGTLTIGSSVTSIGINAFYGCSGFTGSLVIPNAVTSIGEGAFQACSGFTGSLTIGSSVTSIGTYAFYYCSGFTGSLTIPNSVTSIGIGAFDTCSGFTGTLTIGNSVTSIGITAFGMCTGFAGSLVIPNSVTSIGPGAFYGCSGFTGTLTIGSSVTSIGNSAFYGCTGFTGNLVIPNSVTSIGNNAFNSCSGFTGSLIFNSGTCPAIVVGAFTSTGFTNLTVGATSTETIDNWQYFSGFTGSLTIGNSVTSVGDNAFYGCIGFTGSLTIGNSVTSIGNSAFYGCTGFIGSLLLSGNITYVGQYAFNGMLLSIIIFCGTKPTAGGDLTGYTGTFYRYSNQSSWDADPTLGGKDVSTLLYFEGGEMLFNQGDNLMYELPLGELGTPKDLLWDVAEIGEMDWDTLPLNAPIDIVQYFGNEDLLELDLVLTGGGGEVSYVFG